MFDVYKSAQVREKKRKSDRKWEKEKQIAQICDTSSNTSLLWQTDTSDLLSTFTSTLSMSSLWKP